MRLYTNVRGRSVRFQHPFASLPPFFALAPRRERLKEWLIYAPAVKFIYNYFCFLFCFLSLVYVRERESQKINSYRRAYFTSAHTLYTLVVFFFFKGKIKLSRKLWRLFLMAAVLALISILLLSLLM